MSSFIRPEDFWRSLGLQANQTVVHLGSGPGFYLIPAAKIVGPLGKAYGIDILPAMLAEVASRAQRAGMSDRVQLIRANVENDSGSTLPDQVADWVLIANILHQSDQHKIFSEAKRLTKPGGSIVVVEWDTAATPLGPPSQKRVGKKQVITVAASGGLTHYREFKPSPYHYGLLFPV